LVAPGRTSRREGELNNLAHASLARLGLAGRDLASADKVSLGESKRVAIMRAVASGARILFLDEPLSGLDRNGVAVVLELLDLLVKGHGLTLVVVEHLVNQAHLREMVTTSWVLEAGRLAESDLDKSTRTSKVSEPSRPAWLSLLSSSKTELREEPLQAGALVSRFRPTRSARSSRAPALEIRGLVVQRGGRFVFGLGDKASSPGLDLVVDEGETVLLQAPNGWGKSTLLAVLAGALSPARGSIWLFGQRIDPLPPWARYRLGLRLLPAEDRLFPTLRTEEALALVGQRDLLPASLAGKLCGELSGGERKRLALLLAEGAPDERRFAILDEPFRALDEASHSAVFPLLGVNAALVLEPIISASETATLASPLEEGARAGGVQA
jgi:branched-chain amino acid transport system ATP-binding protein